jgi:hypothetical protein
MPIPIQPPANVVSAYRPVQFEAFTTGTITTIVQNAVVKLFFKGVEVSEFRVKSYATTPNLFLGTDDYLFCIDVAERLRDLLAPFAELPSQFAFDCPTTPVDNVDSIGNFYIDITYEYLDLADGLIKTQIGINDISNEFWAAAITRQHLENMYFSPEFTESVFPPLGRALTNSETTIEACRTDNLFLSYLVDPSGNPLNAYQITLFDSVGGTIGTAEGFLNSTALTAHIFTLNVGIENGLKCLVNFQESIGFDLDDPNVACYTISAGILFLSTYLRAREEFKYNLTTACKCCDKRKFRLHWLNCLDGVDSYTFCSIKELKQKTSAVIAERSLAWDKASSLAWDKASLTPNNITDVGQFKKQSNVEQRFLISSVGLISPTVGWLAEMLGSVKVYLEIEPNKIVSVIIEDSDPNNRGRKRKNKITIGRPVIVLHNKTIRLNVKLREINN